MRAKSNITDGYIVYGVSGTNTISFAIDFRNAKTKGLLGFSVERINKKTGERKFVDGFKVFKDSVPAVGVSNTTVSTYNQPVQSFVWDDFTCYDDNEYEYLFYPIKGTPEHLDRSAAAVSLTIKTEALFSKGEHDIFFNRGVASSQAYSRKFFNLPPNKIEDPVMKKAAMEWLSRKLDDALIKFIGQAKSGDTLLGCFYEFHYAPVLNAFKKAIDTGVNVKLIIDAKENGKADAEGDYTESFPRQANLEALRSSGISVLPEDGIVIQREANPNNIQHNKFIVFVDKSKISSQVWTGSTNISEGGIHGQTNVGHWIRNKKTAKKFEQYWNLLSTDPGQKRGEEDKSKNPAYKKEVEKLQTNIAFVSWDDIPVGITPVFSPRNGKTILETYVKMLCAAENMACVTLAFGINKLFKDNLLNHTPEGPISFLLLEKEDGPGDKPLKEPFKYIGAKQNVYKSWGAYLQDELYQWTRETSNRGLGLNKHVAYIHSKFMLVDPLSNDPKVVTGSANFSDASTNSNDENMIIIRGNKRVADIYFTEFNRLFHHFYFRAVYNNAKKRKQVDTASPFLDHDDRWLEKYKPGLLKFKRVEMFTKMEGF
ncbi:phospholipase D-like domain-containing protein [Flavobacterium sp. IB48]|uniref:phospholipase D-like domain-containing protein n=1 Tax=Flavobacterium sp. IB48 TaxID=2779375 RepID=UPI0018E721B4|nr:phospholipase D-like domain-containing protein [Flavobacterium sp. IB48]MBJ2126588.1 hypothetical protein [Flavobacterium sp. IB48]